MHRLILLMLLIVMGCKTIRSDSRTEIKDSSIVRITPRWVPVGVPERRLDVNMKIECDPVTNKPKPVTQAFKGDKTSGAINLDAQGNLTGNVTCDSLQHLVEVRDSTITRLRFEKTAEVKTIIKEVYKTYWFDQVARTIAIICILFILIKNARRIKSYIS
jgi:hypothetical protein